MTFYEEDFELSSCKWLSGFKLLSPSVIQPDQLVSYLNSKGIGASQFWQPLSKQVMFKNCIKLLDSSSTKIADTFVVLPSSTDLEDAKLEYIVNTIINYFNKLV